MMENNEKMEKKIEEFNEFMLKQAAITFSMEGLSKDLKSFLQKKITHNRDNLSQIALMLSAIAQSNSKELHTEITKKGHSIHSLLEHLTKEIRYTDMALNLIIQNLLTKEAILSSENQKSEKD